MPEYDVLRGDEAGDIDSSDGCTFRLKRSQRKRTNKAAFLRVSCRVLRLRRMTSLQASIAPDRREVGKEQCSLAITIILWYPDA